MSNGTGGTSERRLAAYYAVPRQYLDTWYLPGLVPIPAPMYYSFPLRSWAACSPIVPTCSSRYLGSYYLHYLSVPGSPERANRAKACSPATNR